ncbi:MULTISPECIES: pseudouridine synthase [Bacillaceae]|uniref:Pseudouridine synthase n=1 Tax=Domibacillus aminovorans TaxID=29332 RepID=A0A177KRH0_9BACI|nr:MULTISPECIES: pseudouridine synthase [Bacillaceae]OAH55929.1 pseudouridine synthase [Domibacillus aminovorans]
MERLQKVIAQAGIASRRKAEQLIEEGKVTVNGKKITELGTKVGLNDEVEVEGVPIERERKVYYLFYKPRGIISAVTDDKNRKTVVDYFPYVEERIFPVGRLDYDTSGLLLMTNDGEFANLMTHPRYQMDKTYIVKTEGIVERHLLKRIMSGVQLEDGKTAPAKVKELAIDRKKNRSLLEVTIHEGRNRQVRRMFETIGHPVQKLRRERFAHLTLHGLNAGEYRELTAHEVKQLRTLAETGSLR